MESDCASGEGDGGWWIAGEVEVEEGGGQRGSTSGNY